MSPVRASSAHHDHRFCQAIQFPNDHGVWIGEVDIEQPKPRIVRWRARKHIGHTGQRTDVVIVELDVACHRHLRKRRTHLIVPKRVDIKIFRFPPRAPQTDHGCIQTVAGRALTRPTSDKNAFTSSLFLNVYIGKESLQRISSQARVEGPTSRLPVEATRRPVQPDLWHRTDRPRSAVCRCCPT